MSFTIIDPTAQVTTSPQPYLISTYNPYTGEYLIAYQINAAGGHQIGRYASVDGAYLGDWGIFNSTNTWTIIDGAMPPLKDSRLFGSAFIVRALDSTGNQWILLLTSDGALNYSQQLSQASSAVLDKWPMQVWGQLRNTSIFIPGPTPGSIAEMDFSQSGGTPFSIDVYTYNGVTFSGTTYPGLPSGSRFTSVCIAGQYLKSGSPLVLALLDQAPNNVYYLGSNYWFSAGTSNPNPFYRILESEGFNPGKGPIYTNPSFTMLALFPNNNILDKGLTSDPLGCYVMTAEGALIDLVMTLGTDGQTYTAAATINTNWIKIPIKSVTATNPVVIQTNGLHGFAVGDQTVISGTGIAGLDGQQGAVTIIDSTHFSIPVNGTGFSTTVQYGALASYVLTPNMIGRGGINGNKTALQYSSDTNKFIVTLMMNSPGSTDYHPYIYAVDATTFIAQVIDPWGDGGQQSVTGGGIYPVTPSRANWVPPCLTLGGVVYSNYNKPMGFVLMPVLGKGASGSGNVYPAGKLLRWAPWALEPATTNHSATIVNAYGPTTNAANLTQMFGIHCDNPVTGEMLLEYMSLFQSGGSWSMGASVIGRFNTTTGAYLGDWGAFGQSTAYEFTDSVLTFDPDNNCFFVQAYDSTATSNLLKIDPNGNILSAVKLQTLFGSTATNSKYDIYTTRNPFTGDIWLESPDNGNYGRLNRAATPCALSATYTGAGGGNSTNQMVSVDFAADGSMYGTPYNQVSVPNTLILKYDPTTQTTSSLWTSTVVSTAWGLKYDIRRNGLWLFCDNGTFVFYDLKANTATYYDYIVSIPVTNITNTNPAIVTTDRRHGFIDGDSCTLFNVAGMTQINGQALAVTYIDETHFALPVDATGFSAYTGGGAAGQTQAFNGGLYSAINYDAYRDCMWINIFTGENTDPHPYIFQVDLNTMYASVWDPVSMGDGLNSIQEFVGSDFYGSYNPNTGIFALDYMQLSFNVPNVYEDSGDRPMLTRVNLVGTNPFGPPPPPMTRRRLGIFIMT